MARTCIGVVGLNGRSSARPNPDCLALTRPAPGFCEIVFKTSVRRFFLHIQRPLGIDFLIDPDLFMFLSLVLANALGQRRFSHVKCDVFFMPPPGTGWEPNSRQCRDSDHRE